MRFKVTLTGEGDILIANSTASPSPKAFILPARKIDSFLSQPTAHRDALVPIRGLGGAVVSLMLSSRATTTRLSDDIGESTANEPSAHIRWPGLRFDAGLFVLAYTELPLHVVNDPEWQHRHGLDLVVRPNEVVACKASRTPDFRRLVIKALPENVDRTRSQYDVREIADAIIAYGQRPKGKWDWR